MPGQDKLALYIHWPYCARICPYCDFNVYRARRDDGEALIRAMCADLRHWRDLSGPRRLISIHFGGGTPSLLQARHLAALIDLAVALWTPTADLEIGLEANPNDVNAETLTAWRDVGIERLSLGVQSFGNHALQALGRDHGGAQARAALELAGTQMPRVSLDLIYGWAGQTQEDLDADLHTALASGVGHISTYQLTIEEKTAFGRALKRGRNMAVRTETSADLFEHLIARLGAEGYSQYEVSNFARAQAERSRHNLAYWQGVDYAGIGPGAHGRLWQSGTRFASVAALKPSDYIQAVNETGSGRAEWAPLAREDIADEYVLMGLRIRDGLSLSHYQTLAGHALAEDRIEALVAQGLLVKDGDRLAASPKGRLVLDALTRHLLA